MATTPCSSCCDGGLCTAARLDHPECLEALLAAGADPDEDGALHEAAKGKLKCLSLLLAAGASPGRFHGGRAPLHAAALCREDEAAACASALLAAGASCRARVQTASYGVPQWEGASPLHLSIAAKAYRAASALLAAGADPSATDARDRGPIHYMQRIYESPQAAAEAVVCLEDLAAHGADLAARDSGMRTALDTVVHCLVLSEMDPPLVSATLPVPAALLALGGGGRGPSRTAAQPEEPIPGLFAEALATAERYAAGLRVGFEGPRARLLRQLGAGDSAAAKAAAAAAGAGHSAFARLRALRAGAHPPGEAWWGEDAEARPPRFCAVLLDRAARAAVVRQTAETAAVEAAVRSVRALQQWQQGRASASSAAAPMGEEEGGGGGAKAQDRLAWAAAACIAKWWEIEEFAEASRAAEVRAGAAVAAALERTERIAGELRQRVVV